MDLTILPIIQKLLVIVIPYRCVYAVPYKNIYKPHISHADYTSWSTKIHREWNRAKRQKSSVATGQSLFFLYVSTNTYLYNFYITIALLDTVIGLGNQTKRAHLNTLTDSDTDNYVRYR